MLTIAVSILTLSFIVTSGQILLYNTENNQKFEKFDCLYHIRKNGEKIPYCRRLKENGLLARDRKKCENEGEMQLFRSLLEQNIEPMYVLSWNSSIETVDIYASIFYNQSRIEPNDYRFLCKCIKAGTFGKYCEYELTHDAQSFDEALNIQFQQKRTDSWNTQRYGKILCYETLSCESSILCLDWREICDGLQRCKSGIDEENCDLLEFNECEDDEFRCTDGMCIPEQSWLDGKY
jgi:hypothetical protein